MDPIEEFEFKPLTEGLGFHKKAEQIRADMKSVSLAEEKISRSVPEIPHALIQPTVETTARPASQSISDLIASLPPSLDFLEEKSEPLVSKGFSTSAPSYGAPARKPTGDFQSPLSDFNEDLAVSKPSGLGLDTPFESKFDPKFESADFGRPQIFQPLPREEFKTAAAPTAAPLSSAGGGIQRTEPAPTFPTPGTFAGTAGKVAVDESFTRAFPRVETSKVQAVAETPETKLVRVPVSIPAGILDSVVVLGMSTLFLVCILAITKVDLLALLSHAGTGSATQTHLGLLYFAVLNLYMLTSRSVFGASLGDWAFDQQLGDDEQKKRVLYPLQVTWRTVLITFTGVIILPILSLLIRRDVAYYLTGLHLHRKAD